MGNISPPSYDEPSEDPSNKNENPNDVNDVNDVNDDISQLDDLIPAPGLDINTPGVKSDDSNNILDGFEPSKKIATRPNLTKTTARGFLKRNPSVNNYNHMNLSLNANDDSYSSEVDVLGRRLKKRMVDLADLQPGYLSKSMVFSGDPESHPVFRFKSMAMSKQNEDYFNLSPESSDHDKELEEIEMKRKEDLSNGVVLVNRKRILNFETGSFPGYYLNLRND